MSSSRSILIKKLGLRDYQETWQAMRDFTDQRTSTTASEICLLQHPPVFTQGQAGKEEHLLQPGDIPVIQTDRGGQVTYHGPGQMVAYVLLGLKSAGLGIRQLVNKLEESVVMLLAEQGIAAQSRQEAPGVYVGDAKIASLGLRVRRGYSYHGLALNIDMDLSPFERINPCGMSGLKVTQLTDIGYKGSIEQIEDRWTDIFCQLIHYEHKTFDAEKDSQTG